jgi:hypothetical protein
MKTELLTVLDAEPVVGGEKKVDGFPGKKRQGNKNS